MTLHCILRRRIRIPPAGLPTWVDLAAGNRRVTDIRSRATFAKISKGSAPVIASRSTCSARPWSYARTGCVDEAPMCERETVIGLFLLSFHSLTGRMPDGLLPNRNRWRRNWSARSRERCGATGASLKTGMSARGLARCTAILGLVLLVVLTDRQIAEIYCDVDARPSYVTNKEGESVLLVRNIHIPSSPTSRRLGYRDIHHF